MSGGGWVLDAPRTRPWEEAPWPRNWVPEVVTPAWRIALLAAVAGGLLDVGVRGGFANLAVAVGIATVVAALLIGGARGRVEPRVLAGAALLPALFLAVRTSPWLVASNLAAAAALLGAAILFARSGSVLDTSPIRALRRLEPACVRALLAPVLLRPLLPGVSRETGGRIARTALACAIVLPPLAVVVGLLAQADAVFAGLLSPNVAVLPVAGHLVLAGVLALVVLGTVAAAGGDAADDLPAGRFGLAETVTMLGLMAAVLGLFVAAQLVALTSAGDRLVEEAGLTPAEYARSGFFQLCWASATLVVLLAAVRGLAAPGVFDRRAVRILGGAVPALALGLVVVSLRRMALYDRAFGLTMLRLWVIGAAVWLGALLVMMAVRNLGAGRFRQWVTAGALAVGVGLVLLGDVANPEAFVVRHNLARAADGAELDLDYLAGLSDDAVPALARADLGPPLRRDRILRCRHDRTGVAALNLASEAAADTRREVCGGGARST